MKLLAFAIICLLVFAAVALTALGDEPRAFDQNVILAFRNPENPADPIGPFWLLEMARDLTALAGWPVLSLMSLLLSGYLLLRRRYATVIVLLAALIGHTIIVQVLKGYFERARPTIAPQLVETVNHSFPSGHATSAAAVYFILAAILARRATRRAERIYLFSAAAMMVLLVGASRVYLGVHYISDVIAGFALGGAWASLVWYAANALEGRRPQADDSNSETSQ